MNIFHKRLETMKLKLLLKKDGEILFEIPLSMEEWPKQRLETELTFSKNELEKFSKLFDALSHKIKIALFVPIHEKIYFW